jgi:hypothetical protein
MKNTYLTISTLIFFTLSGVNITYASDRVISVSQDSSAVSVIEPNQVVNDEVVQEVTTEIAMPVTAAAKDEKNWLDSLFGSNEEKPLVPTLDSDEQNILLDKEFLDPDEHIVKSKKRWEQSIVKKLPDQVAEPYLFFNSKPSGALSSRMYIDEREGKIYFLVKQGSLKQNIDSLMSDTRNTKHLIWKVGNHKVFAEYWVSGHSMFEVVNNILKPYKQPDQVMFGVFLGDTIGVFYKADKEFWL